MHVCVRVCERVFGYMCTCVHMHWKQRLALGVIPQQQTTLSFEAGTLIDFLLLDLVGLAGQVAPGSIYLDSSLLGLQTKAPTPSFSMWVLEI